MGMSYGKLWYGWFMFNNSKNWELYNKMYDCIIIYTNIYKNIRQGKNL